MNNQIKKEEYYKIKSSTLMIFYSDKNVMFDYGKCVISTGNDPCSRKNLELLINSFNPDKDLKGNYSISFNFKQHTGDAFSFISHEVENEMYYHEALSNCGGFHTKVKINLNAEKRRELYYVFSKYREKLMKKHH